MQMERGNKRFLSYLYTNLKALPFFSERLRGVKFAVSGKLDGLLRVRVYTFMRGEFSTQQIRVPLQLTCSRFANRWGEFGIKIWVLRRVPLL